MYLIYLKVIDLTRNSSNIYKMVLEKNYIKVKKKIKIHLAYFNYDGLDTLYYKLLFFFYQDELLILNIFPFDTIFCK